jgi:ATP-dependent DNA helicase RecG
MPEEESRGKSGVAQRPQAKYIRLTDPVDTVYGIGTHGAVLLARLNIFTVADLLKHYPARWDDRTRFRSAGDVQHGEVASLMGTVAAVTVKQVRPGMTVTEVTLNDAGEQLRLIWFNQPFKERQFQPLRAAHKQIVVFGQVKRTGLIPEIVNPEWEELTSASSGLSANRICPIYPATEGITQQRLRKVVSAALAAVRGSVPDPIPAELQTRFGLMPLEDALNAIHFPEDQEQLAAARRRLIFEEFFIYSVLLAKRRQEAVHRKVSTTMAQRKCSAALKRFEASIPYRLTAAQRRAIAEIQKDLTSGDCMNRLLQGDVGSGKTAVAMAAILMAAENGGQSALMAPTELLAQQHAAVLKRWLSPLNIQVEFQAGSLPASERRRVLAVAASGEADVLVGTHALIQSGTEFKNLSLAIVDEQHRFGVLQRQALAQKGQSAHLLVMTATPIPRTLTLTLYGDLDVSILNEMPPGRKPIVTHWKSPEKRDSVYQAALKVLAKKQQVYVVCALVEESEKLQAANAEALAQELSTTVFSRHKVGMVHGQLKPEQKEAVMAAFASGELDVLVATTVIEVGIDVPNATVMIVEDADRFGLAQLHQLRGRVGRGEFASYCVLIGAPPTQIGKSRLQAMVDTSDGFQIAEEDLNLRGPGEFFGTKQSGAPEFAIANVLRDHEILLEARAAAFELTSKDPQLAHSELAPLRMTLRDIGNRMAAVLREGGEVAQACL